MSSRHRDTRTGHRGTRTGWTTGACSAAAARAATFGVCSGAIPEQVATHLPNGQWVTFTVAQSSLDAAGATAVVIKDAGDDPDCTHGAHLVARVEPWFGHPGEIHLTGGAGVGRVTRPGLGLAVGERAINPIPRENIIANVRAAAAQWLQSNGLTVTLSVPGGELLAQKTLNPRLGIIGGISILGTTGIVYPYSTSAYKAAVVQAIHGAAATGLNRIVLTTGRRTERFAMERLPDWPDWSFVQMGDFVGAALEAACAVGLHQVVVVAMGGKLAKMAQGVRNTHAHKTTLDMNRVAELAAQCGCDPVVMAAIAQGTTVRFAVEEMVRAGLAAPFYQRLATAAHAGIQPWLRHGTEATVLALDFEGRFMTSAGAPLS
ncbi:MAG: cobalt-precorrin-5B (C(1))-methyltransferase [Magnetococcales bacterium]|nr:cobalt-precorrin-5B (C(1))-methyltransferase [Magnetococcales bacterium]MBF0148443.1 cobalt-precorrin-5B (C(1))-methyltransferase [Magnetococcales bacterium]MBF0346307.1 cobalt-precorrin-5B (C(1))-methyltransferase [Magnetococcales bacterium]MBF0631701.1 cobalt-precorrin-5B (C(1))-methyltransferase [Magnetococcales bacterium]